MIGITATALADEAPPEGVPVMEIKGNTFKIAAAEDFAMGTFEKAEVIDSAGGGVRLLAGEKEGEFTSCVYEVAPFEYLVASWNAYTPPGTYVELKARAYVDMYDEWTQWVSWGEWGAFHKRASTNDRGERAMIDTDIFTVLGNAGETASLVQLKAVLHSEDVAVSPIVYQIAATYKNTLPDQQITPIYLEETVELPEAVMLDTPAYSQMTREGSIANVMCSAVTICTMLNDRGEDLLPEEVASLAYDYYYEGFGNWPYSVAAAAAYGYEAYVQYADFDILRQELARGYSVGISVSYSSTNTGSYNYLENGAANNTPGHLITITGYETVDGVDYFFSSDSAATGDANCVRRYRADQLDKAWASRTAYIVHDKILGREISSTKRIAGELRYVEDGQNEYALYVDGIRVELPVTYLTRKFKELYGGITACIIEGDPLEPVPEPARRTTANNVFKYSIPVTNGGNLRIDPDKLFINVPEGESKNVVVYLMGNDGTTYVASVSIAKGIPPQPEPTPEESAGTEQPAGNEPGEIATAPPDTTTIIIIAVAAVAVIGVVGIVVAVGTKRRKG